MNALATSLLLACIGVLLAWLLRRPIRRLTGAGPAFCLWALPPLLAAVAWLPAWHTTATSVAAILTLPPLLVKPHATIASSSSGIAIVPILFGLWLAGCAAMLARLALHCLRIARQSRPLPATMCTAIEPHTHGLDPRIMRLHPAGPAVCWLPRCRLLLPVDLLDRFDHEQLTQVIAHERMHLARRDHLWSLLAELMLAALWFFLPAWLAMNRFRLDQELACDAAILRNTPHHTGAYARALLSSATQLRELAATTPWLTQSQLKERLTMIQNHPRTLLHHRGGYLALATILAGTALAAHAAMPTPNHANPARALMAMQTTPVAPASVPGSAHVIESTRVNNPPRYPPAAIKNHQQGTVMLRVHVNAQGKATQIT